MITILISLMSLEFKNVKNLSNNEKKCDEREQCFPCKKSYKTHI